MATNTNALLIPGTGEIWVAAVDTPEPTAAPGVGWTDLGHTSTDGVTVTREVTTEPRPTWQAPGGARSAVTDQTFTVSFTSLQVDATNLRLFFGGGIVDVGPPIRFQIPKVATPQKHALYVLMKDGTVEVPLYIPSVEIISGGESEGNPEGYFTLPLVCTGLASDNADFLATLGGPGIVAP